MTDGQRRPGGRPDLNLMVVLDAILAEGGITRAAERLNLSQPAISHALGRLRDVFGDELFVRRGRQMVPTPLCRALAEPMRRSLRALERAIQDATHFDPASSQRRFTIAVRDVMEARIIAPLSRMVAAEAPEVHLTCTHVDRSRLEESLSSGAVDVAVDVALMLPESIQRQRLEGAELCVVARRDHPVAQGAFSLEDYLACRHILVSRRRQGGGFEDMELSQLGLQRDIALRCQQYFTACFVVSQTDMIATIPRHVAAISNGGLDNQVLPLPFRSRLMDLYLYWHQNHEADQANRWIRNRIAAVCADG